MRVINFKELDVDIRSKLRLISLVRVLIITILLGTTIAYEIFDVSSFVNTTLITLYSIAVLTYIFSILAIYLEKKNIIKRFEILSYLHIVWDILLATSIVFITGGIQSIFSFMYFFAIVNASVLQKRVGAYIAASTSWIFYTSLLAIEYYSSISYASLIYDIHYYPEPSELWQMIAINLTAFFAIAVLISYLAEQLSKTKSDLAKTSIDVNRLKLLNKNIVESLNSGLITTDPSGMINFANAASERITGYNFAEIKNKNIKEFFIFTKEEILPNKNSHEPNLPWKWEDYFTTKSGGRINLGVNCVKLKSPEGVDEGQIFIFQDLTQFKILEEKMKRQDRLAAVGKLAAGIAHEIRNPLASVSGSTQLLKEMVDLQDNRLFNIILRETDRLNGLITGFLMFVKPPPLKLEKILPQKIIDEIIKNTTRDFDIVENSEIVVKNQSTRSLHADYSQIKQALSNVVKNAVEAMVGKGILTITIQDVIAVDGKNRGFVEFTITDTGVGIDPVNLDKIFDPFFTTKPRVPGLGLATTYKIVELHNGDIVVNSVINEGTSVKIKIPAYLE